MGGSLNSLEHGSFLLRPWLLDPSVWIYVSTTWCTHVYNIEYLVSYLFGVNSRSTSIHINNSKGICSI